jgi:hypothetical protein
MKLPTFPAVVACLLVSLVPAGADNPKASAPPPRITKETRMNIIRTFDQDLVYVRAPFPMGRAGLTLKDGKLSPSGQQVEEMISMWGSAAKAGDRALITDVKFQDNRIHFEINGGPVRKKKWYQHIEVGGAGGTVPLAPTANTNPRGSFVDLVFDKYIPDMSMAELEKLLGPVFDFHAKTALEAYLATVPPNVKDAIQHHRVLVGMNQDMVLWSKGRPPKKIREKDSAGAEYEEWIYGEPPQEVDFVRFVGDEVVRVENMSVTGQKTVRTAKEVNLPTPTVAKTAEPEARPAGAPSLRRPGEVDPDAPVGSPGDRQRPVAPPPPINGGPPPVDGGSPPPQ